MKLSTVNPMDKTVKKEIKQAVLTIFVIVGSLVAIVFFITKSALHQTMSAAYRVTPSNRLDAGSTETLTEGAVNGHHR